MPIVSDAGIYNKVATLGEELANLEKKDYIPDNILGYNYDELMDKIPAGFKLSRNPRPFDAENELLILKSEDDTIEIYCPIALQNLNISGYDVIKAVWLKFNSYSYTHCDFGRDDMRRLLDFLNTLATHTQIVARIDDEVSDILHEKYDLILPE